MNKNEVWILKGRKGDAVEIAERIGISRRLAALLLTRLQCDEGMSLAESAAEFLQPDVGRLHGASEMKGMDKALEMLGEAARMQKKTLIVGDYDVDGIMGVLILKTVLKKAIKPISHYLPNRVDDGYGINERIVEAARRDGVELIITCDNGVSARGPIKLAKALGMEVIVTDHHIMPVEDDEYPDETEGFPDADVIINPNRSDCTYPFKDLCGAAVAFKIATAFADHFGISLTDEERDDYFCYAAIATVCDIVALTGENRRIVYHGLKLLNRGVRNRGLAELIKKCGLSGRELNANDIGFIIGPCLNAAGRLDSAELAYGLLVEAKLEKISAIAERLVELNNVRQELTVKSYDEAIRIIESERLADDKIIVAHMRDTHESICGIIAGRLKDKFARPAVVLTDTPSGLAKGSGRSVEGFDLQACVKTVKDLLIKFGGHKMAVGITADRSKIGMIRAGLNENCMIDPELLAPKIMIDLCIDGEDITPGFVDEISRLEPFGKGNEKPVFATKNAAVDFISLIGRRRNAVKMKIRLNGRKTANSSEFDSTEKKGTAVDALYFGDVGAFMEKLGLAADAGGILTPIDSGYFNVDIAFYPEINDFNNIRKMQLIIRGIRKSC